VPLGADRILTGARAVGFGAQTVDRLGLREGSSTGGAPTAVVVSSWFVAVGVARRLGELGLGLGSDVSLVLTEGTPAPFEGWSGPALTTVADQVAEVARVAWPFVSPADTAAARVADSAADVVRLAPTLVPGATSGPAPG